MKLYTTSFESTFGIVHIAVDEAGALVRLGCDVDLSDTHPYTPRTDGDEIVLDADRCAHVVEQMREYLSGERKAFTLPLAMRGTEFQKRVWKALLEIPYGTVTSYSELATRLGNLAAVRAVGRANGANPIAIVVPCHRVIGADGSLTGYAGGLGMKQRLLELEGVMTGMLFRV